MPAQRALPARRRAARVQTALPPRAANRSAAGLPFDRAPIWELPAAGQAGARQRQRATRGADTPGKKLGCALLSACGRSSSPKAACALLLPLRLTDRLPIPYDESQVLEPAAEAKPGGGRRRGHGGTCGQPSGTRAVPDGDFELEAAPGDNVVHERRHHQCGRCGRGRPQHAERGNESEAQRDVE